VLVAWMLKTKMLEVGIDVSLQAVITFLRSSGSLIKNFMSAVWMACASSYDVYDGFVPAKIPPLEC
jgi:hypothetical protein